MSELFAAASADDGAATDRPDHAVFGDLAPIGPDRELVAPYCAAGVTVKDHADYASEHVSLLVTNAPATMDWLGDRFADLPPPDNC